MTTTSNLYAEKVFAEHPIGLWSLDEQVDYVSLINETNRDMSIWTAKNELGNPLSNIVDSYLPNDTLPPDLPVRIFENSVVNLISAPDIVGSGSKLVSLTSQAIANDADMNEFIDSFSISTYIFPFAKKIDVTIGYEYTDPANPSTPIRVEKTYYVGDVQQWAFITGFFNKPENFQDLKIILEVAYNGPATDYQFIVHGTTIGQWSEQFHVESLGVELSDINSERSALGLSQLTTDLIGVDAKSYGLQSKSGYYIANNNSLCATNSGMPLVYGAYNSTKITPNASGNPSLVLPGFGFMNTDGQYKELTLEMWIKIQSSATTPKRIVGPVSSDDGLYVNDAFLVLKINSEFGSYYVGEWDRPMLLSIRISGDSASLTINGEEVIFISFADTVISFPEKNTVIEGGTVDHDWIGFYSYLDVPSIELDCVGIYPYIVPNIVEKRRLVYGQGVEIPENIAGSDIGTSVMVDYTFANYAKNYIYPDIGRWQQGINENLSIENSQISVPEYELPLIVFDNKATEQWYADVSEYETLFGTAVSLRPNSSWNDTQGYVLFPTLGILDQDVKAFYALFESNEAVTTKQTLFYIENQVSGDSLEISLTGANTEYTYRYFTPEGLIEEETVYRDTNHVPGGFLFVGLEINKFATYFGEKIIQFFGSKQELKFYLGGSRLFTNTFAGNIYRAGFCTARNLQKISNVFTESGVAVGYNAIDSENAYDAGDFTNDQLTNYWEQLADGGDEYFGNLNTPYDDIVDGGGVYSLLVDKMMAHIASYTLFPKTFLGNFTLDIAVNGYWQDYLPLSYFAKYVKDGTLNADGTESTYLDLDFIQFNVSYPQINKFLKAGYDTSDSIVKTYISFQYLKNASTVSTSYFTKVEKARKDGVIEPGTDWQNTKYEIVNDMIIYPPGNADFQTLALVLHIEIFSNGAKENPVKIQSLQLASQALNAFVANPVGTRYGMDVYPYRKTGEYFDYKGRNPFSIYKGSTPYLYLTSNSGLRMRGSDKSLSHGISIPINKNTSAFYKVAAWQMALRYEDELFPEQATEIFEIQAVGKEVSQHIKFYMKPDTANLERARVFAIDATTGFEQDGIMFYVNGKLVSRPYINLRTWTMVGIVFNAPVDFSGNAGALRFNGPLMFNNVSHYQSTEADEASRSIYRRWSGVKDEDGTSREWEYWRDLEIVAGQAFKWRNVLFISSENFEGVDGEKIYKKYTGTDRVVIDTDQVFRIHNYQYNVYKDLVWKSSVVITT